MTGTSYYWQGGRKIEIEPADRAITVETDDIDEVRAAARRAGIRVERADPVAPCMIRMEVGDDRDAAMERLRQSHTVHHVYHTQGQPDDELLVTETFFIKFREDTPKRNIRQYLRDEHLQVINDFGRKRLLVRVTNETRKNPIRTANEAVRREDVEYAEPNLVRELIRFSFFPADPLFSRQWHLHAPADGPELVEDADIDAPQAWARTIGLRDVVIAVPDDGIDLTHPDFQGPGKIAGRIHVRIDGAGLAFDEEVSPRPGDYHGTPCAGVALAEHNGLGTVGVAPGCSLLAVRFPLSLSDAQLALMFEKISPLADVVSCSWGVGPAMAPMASVLRERIEELAGHGGRRGKGLVICVAAGNNNCPVRDLENTRTYPYLDRFGIKRYFSGPIDRWIATHPDVVTVSACTSLKTRSAYSSWGREINVCAPSNNFDDLQEFTPRGLGIVTTDNEGFGPRSDFTPGSRYTERFGGTSSATPTVAGVCALVISQNQSLAGRQVRQIIEQTAKKDLRIESETDVVEPGDFDSQGFSLWFGHGKVNAGRAVDAASSDQMDTLLIDEESSDQLLPIPDDGTPIESPIEIAEEGIVGELRVGIEIEHSYIGDLRVDLIAPNGTSVVLHNQERAWGQNLRRIYTPRDVPALRGLEGRTIRGTWRLRVMDAWSMDQGVLHGWRLLARLTAQPDPVIERESATSGSTARSRRKSRRKSGRKVGR